VALNKGNMLEIIIIAAIIAVSAVAFPVLVVWVLVKEKMRE
jgi:hypothetical protein